MRVCVCVCVLYLMIDYMPAAVHNKQQPLWPNEIWHEVHVIGMKHINVCQSVCVCVYGCVCVYVIRCNLICFIGQLTVLRRVWIAAILNQLYVSSPGRVKMIDSRFDKWQFDHYGDILWLPVSSTKIPHLQTTRLIEKCVCVCRWFYTFKPRDW